MGSVQEWRHSNKGLTVAASSPAPTQFGNQRLRVGVDTARDRCTSWRPMLGVEASQLV